MGLSDGKEKDKIFKIVHEYKQEHIFKYWDQLDKLQQQRFLGQISTIDFPLLKELSGEALDKKNDSDVSCKLETADMISLKEREKLDADSISIGEEVLKKGEVAIFLVAGGQGSRLGFDGPKGVYPVTPVKNKSLFQVFAEKILVLNRRYDINLSWYIMTNISNKQTTAEFFKSSNYFGLEEKKIQFVNQDMLPAIDRYGKLILDARDHIFMNPNGHGGSLKALWDSGTIEIMKQEGIKYIFYFQVDNVLARIVDPAFLGYHMQAGSQMSNKVVRKAYPEEKMGIICKINGRNGVVEYSDLNPDDMYATDSEGQLKFWAGSVAIHLINVDFIEEENRSGFKLPYHIAEKSIPFLDENGNLVKPEDKNGIKFETFVFDALLDTKRSVSVEIERKREFSPLKNKNGLDSIDTVKKDLLTNYAAWFKKAGFDIPVDENGCPPYDIEISPTFALDLAEFLARKNEITRPEPGLYLK